jgi:hypothetical protein
MTMTMMKGAQVIMREMKMMRSDDDDDEGCSSDYET